MNIATMIADETHAPREQPLQIPPCLRCPNALRRAAEPPPATPALATIERARARVRDTQEILRGMDEDEHGANTRRR